MSERPQVERAEHSPRPAPPSRLPAIATAAALVALVAWSLWQRWQVLTATPFPIGVDGYFYPLELRGLLAHGALPYPASPLTFWLFAPFAAITDPVTGAKLGAAIGGALIALPAYGVGARLGRGRGPGLLAAVLATTSAGSAFLTVEFVKNGLGLTIATTAIWLALRALERPSYDRLAAVLAALIATVLVHKMAVGLALVLIVPATIANAVARGLLGRRLLRWIAAGAGVLGATVLVLGALAPRRFLSLADLGLLGGLLGAHASWSAPALEMPRFTLTVGHEALIGGLIALVAVVALISERRDRRRPAPALSPALSPSERGAAYATLGLALALALPWLRVDDPQGLGFRLRLVAFLPMALGAAIVARVAAGWLAARARELAVAAAAVAVFVAVNVARPTGTAIPGEIDVHPALVSAALALDGLIPTGDTVIIPERHILFMVAWYTNVHVALRPDGIPRDRRWRLMPLAFIGAGSPLDRALTDARREPALEPPIGLHPRHPNGLVLVRESTWEWVLARLPPSLESYYGEWTPY